MTTTSSKTFRSGNSQAVRLPRDVAFRDQTDVTVIRSGDVLTIYPTKRSLTDLVDGLRGMARPAAVEVRDTDPLPERPGL